MDKMHNNNTATQKLSNSALSEFRALYFKHYGTSLTPKEADDIGWKFLKLMKAVYKPIPKDYGK